MKLVTKITTVKTITTKAQPSKDYLDDCSNPALVQSERISQTDVPIRPQLFAMFQQLQKLPPYIPHKSTQADQGLFELLHELNNQIVLLERLDASEVDKAVLIHLVEYFASDRSYLNLLSLSEAIKVLGLQAYSKTKAVDSGNDRNK